MNTKKRLFKKNFLKRLTEKWILYASKYNDKRNIKMYYNGLGECKISELLRSVIIDPTIYPSSDHSLNEKIVYKGKNINRAVAIWFDLKN